MNILLSGMRDDRVEMNLSAALAAAGNNVYVINGVDSAAAEWCRSHALSHVEYSFRHRFDLQAIDLYRNLFRQYRYDIVHCQTSRALSTALLATRNMRNPPKIVAYRGTVGHLHRWDPISRLSHLHPRVGTIACVSGAVRRYLLNCGIPDARLAVIWKGHDPAWYVPAPRMTLLEFGIPPSAVVACFVGNIRPVKGVDVLLDAFDTVAPDEHLHLIIIGEIRDRRIGSRIGCHPCVHFTGFRPDAAALAGACDIAVMPSIGREGLPRAILEAMAQGVPPVVTDVGGLSELVVDSECGIVVPPRDPRALRDALFRLARNSELRCQLGANARARIAGPFHFRHTVEKTINLYQRLLAEDNPPSVL